VRIGQALHCGLLLSNTAWKSMADLQKLLDHRRHAGETRIAPQHGSLRAMVRACAVFLAQRRVLGRHAGALRVQVRQSACPQDAGDSCASPRVALCFTSGHVLERRRERSLQRQHARLPIEPVLPEA